MMRIREIIDPVIVVSNDGVAYLPTVPNEL